MEQVKKIMIVGSKGMAGHMLYHYFKENTKFDVVDIARGTQFFIPVHQLDVTDFSKLSEVLSFEKPDYVVNCIGILNQDAESNPDKAILINSYLPHRLAKLGKEYGFKLIHISTDCVFNGKKGGYSEESLKDGFGVYAESKALGEVSYDNNLTIRTSIIGPELKTNGIGLFDWFMQQNGKIKGYTNAIWTGVTTLELAKAIVVAIQYDIKGLHHLVNNEKINKYDLTQLFKQVFRKDQVEIEPYSDYVVDKSLVKTNEAFEYHVPSYLQMIEEMKEWMDEHQTIYSHYFQGI